MSAALAFAPRGFVVRAVPGFRLAIGITLAWLSIIVLVPLLALVIRPWEVGIFEILCELKDEKLRGIFHCFSGSLEQANKVIELGFYLGIGGVLTYKNSGLDKVVQDISLEHLVLETDSPYLAPVPFRGKRNESSYLVNVVNKLAEVYDLSPIEIARITTENSVAVFGI